VAGSVDRYTLIVPTYNRPALMSRQLLYLARRRFPYPVMILDSSEDDAFGRNAASIAAAPHLSIRHERYPSAIAPYEKFANGLDLVATPYASFCADDDLLFTETIDACLALLDNNPSFIGAHGLYLNFHEKDGEFLVTYTVYDGPAIDGEDGLARVTNQMRAYQAVFYAIFRTPVLRDSMRVASGMSFVLFQELAQSALALVKGGVARLDRFYMARNTGPSIPYSNWHPHQIIADNAAALFEQYAIYRDVIVEALAKEAHLRDTLGAARMRQVLDVAHLRYLSPLLYAPILDYIMEQNRAGATTAAIAEGIWEGFVMPRRPPYPRRPYRPKALKTRLRMRLNHYWPGRYLKGRPPPRFLTEGDDWLDSVAFDGQQRRYVLYYEFLQRELANGRRIGPSDVEQILRHFNLYPSQAD